MYHKIKSTLAGLGMVAAFVAAGLTLGEPVADARSATRPGPVVQSEAAAAAMVLQTVLSLAAAEAADAAAREAANVRQQHRARASRLRLELGMPYYSFGAVLPRRGES